MRKIYILCLLTLVATVLFAQVPQAFKYQAVARDLNGDPVINQEISVKISILAGSPEGTVVYSEQHQITTNSMGLFTLEIGNPTQVLSGNFAEISWGTAAHFLQTAIDLTGGGDFQVLGVSQFLSVPYALFAGQTGDTTNWQKNEDVVYYNKGQVGIGTNQPDSSAKLDVNSNSQGFLPPRMMTEERDSIPNPAAGLIIFNTDTHCINFFNGSEWVEYGRDPMDTFECGQMFTDPRDKQQYKTVQIGEQCWFAENLNIGTKINASLNQTDNDVVEKYCYENVPANCSEYGGLYQWDELMAYDTLENTRGICPEGWHLPNQAEWQTLFDAFGGAEAAGTELATNGTSGFDALMNGKFDAVAGFSGQNNLSTFWSSSGTLGAQANSFDFTSGSAVVNASNGSVFNGYGVRCLKGLPNVTNPNLKVIDTTVYHLVSDSLEMVQGIYRYEIIGSRKAKDLIVADNLVVGTEIDGYLRKVDEASINGNEMTLTTSDATFEDAFIEGEFSFNAGLTGKSKPALTFTRILYLAPGVEISPQKDGFTYNFSNLVLYEGDNISVTIPQGHFTLDPEFNFDFKFKNKQVKRLSFYADNSILENSLDVQLDVTGSVSKEYEKTLAKIEKYIGFMAGLVPVVVVITTELKGKLDCSFDAAFMATTGYTNTNTVSFGVKYEYGDWQKIWDLKPEAQLHPINWNGTISFGQNLTIVPEIDIRFYGVAGPYFNLPVWEQLDANLAVPEMNFDANLDVGVNGNIGAEVTIFGKTLASYNKELFGFDKNLYNFPAKLEMVSGNNQTGNVNSQLPVPLKVKVTDSKGLTYLPARVHFTVETGGGTLTETDLWTDATGFAQTTWTLGSLASEQTIKAEVFKADGTAINGSPQLFTASTQGTPGQCGQPFTDTRDGQTYNTVQIGNQCWMRENLNFETGNSYCYGNNPANCDTYGRLYYWNTALTACPTGWHLPNHIEWTNLTDQLGGTHIAGGKTKSLGTIEAGTGLWHSPNTNATNTSGFSGFPGGQTDEVGIGYYGTWWSSMEYYSGLNEIMMMSYNNSYLSQGSATPNNRFSVRCLKDETTSSQLNVTPPSQDVLNEAGTATFVVTSNTSWAVEENVSWLSVSSPSGSGNGTLSVSYDVNPENEPRIGQITVTADGGNPVVTVSVNQAGAPQSCGQIVDARDGQIYNTVVIGTQCWMRENLNIGTKITGGDQTNDGIIEKYCYDNNDTNCYEYGGLYQWAETVQYFNGATNTTSWNPIPEGNVIGICPDGWHVPTVAEWTVLSNFLGGDDIAGGKLKEIGYSHWASPNTYATNSNGFTALPAGQYGLYLGYSYLTTNAFFWSATETVSSETWLAWLNYDNGNMYRGSGTKVSFNSVRCLKDN